MEKSLGARWAAGDVDIDRDKTIDAFEDVVALLKRAAGNRAGAHGDAVFGLGHLVPKPDHLRRHFFRDGAGDNEEVRLARGRAKNFGAEAGDVELGHRRGDHLDRATGEAEVERPNRVAVAPSVELLEAGKENTLATEFVALGFGDGGWWRGDFLTQGAILRIPFKHRFQGCIRMETCAKGG